MSNKYSLGGYRIAVQARSSKTILVEGKTDKDLFETLNICRNRVSGINIDTSEIFSDPALAGLGAKARIDFFLSQIPHASNISQKICCFVDREWDGLINNANLDPLPWSYPTLSSIRLTSTGHSIENYGFSVDFVEVYLKHFGKAVATNAVLRDIKIATPELFRSAAAFSEVSRRRQVISKCTDIIGFPDVSWVNGKLHISPNIETRLAERGAQNSADFLKDYYIEYFGKWASSPLSDQAYLHAHGHIGEMLLWAGIGRVVVDHGFSEAIGQEIATGRQDERRRVWHTWLSSQHPDYIAPVDQAFS